MSIITLNNSVITLNGSPISLDGGTPPTPTLSVGVEMTWCGTGCMAGTAYLKCCNGTSVCNHSVNTTSTDIFNWICIACGCYYVDFNSVNGYNDSHETIVTYGEWSDCFYEGQTGKCTCCFSTTNDINYTLYDGVF